MENEVTLGDLVREMARAALNEESGSVSVPLVYLVARMKGVDCSSAQSIMQGLSPDEKDKPKLYLAQLKSSYITNTTARLPEMQERDLKVKSRFFDDEHGRPHIQISLAKGAIKLGSRGKSNKSAQKEISDSVKGELFEIMKLIKSTQPSLIGKNPEDMAAIVEGMSMMLEHIDYIISERIEYYKV